MIKYIDRLIIKELLPFWFFGIAIFTLIILATTYLFKLTDYLVKGIEADIIFKLVALYFPGILVKTFPMAYLLSTLLGYGRLSSDSEIVVLKSSGISFGRIIRPVALFGIVIGGITFLINEAIVPYASIKASQISLDIITKLSFLGSRPQYYPIYDKNQLSAIITAKNFNFEYKILSDVCIITYQPSGEVGYYAYAKQMIFKDDLSSVLSVDKQRWELPKGGNLLSADGKMFLRIKEKTWPHQIPTASFTDTDLISQSLIDPDSLSLFQIKQQINKAKIDPNFNINQRVRLETGFWNKIAMPFIPIIFGLFGASLGTRNHRSNMSSGFWISVIIIFGYMTLVNFMTIYAKNEVISPFIASFTPLLIGGILASITIVQKNR